MTSGRGQPRFTFALTTGQRAHPGRLITADAGLNILRRRGTDFALPMLHSRWVNQLARAAGNGAMGLRGQGLACARKRMELDEAVHSRRLQAMKKQERCLRLRLLHTSPSNCPARVMTSRQKHDPDFGRDS